jgi:hypothetical protein
MSTELPATPLSPEELVKRQKDVRKVVLIRGFLLGLIVAGWWIFFAPDALVEPGLKNILGVAAGLIATGGYYFMLRDSLFPKKNAG